MAPKKTVMSWSSGKDSTFALAEARKNPDFDIIALVSSSNEEFERVAVHGTRRTIAQAQAEALGLPYIDVPLPNPCTDEIYQERMGKAITDLQAKDVDDWIFGDLFLEDVLAYRKSLYAPFDVTLHTPLWGRDTKTLAGEMLASGLEAYLVTLNPEKLPASLCGARYDEAFLANLPDDVDPCGEYGEFHTVVANGPGFAHVFPLKKERLLKEAALFIAIFCCLNNGSHASYQARKRL